MFKIAICDDEYAISIALEQILLKYESDNSFGLSIDIFKSAEELHRCITDGDTFDLIFLDIEMGEMSGIEISKKIREEIKDDTTMIIYISGKDSYVMELFEARPINFLKKPLDEREIIRNLKKCIDLSQKMNVFFNYNIAHEKHKQIIKEILYFESNGRKTKLKTAKGEVFFYGVLKNIHENLRNIEFVQVHKAFIVNYDHITEFGSKEVTLINGEKLPISQSYAPKAKEAFIKIERQRMD